MKRVIVGVYDCGSEEVQVELRSGTNAEFYSKPEKGMCARIVIGADESSWHRMVSVLHHEIMELVMYRMGFRYTHSLDYSNDNGAYLFMMSHTQFSEASARTAMCMADVMPDLSTAHKKWTKQK